MTVTPATIATALGVAVPDSASPKYAQWALWITDALMLINARKARLDVTDELEPVALDYVVREAVVAQARRPDDATQVSVSIDDGNIARTYTSGSGRVTILDEWWALLGLADPNAGAFSVDTVSSTGGAHLPWCALAFGATYCSCGADIAGFPIFELGR